MTVNDIWEHKRKKTKYTIVGGIKSIRYDEEDGWIPVDFVCYKEIGTSNSECYAQPKSIFLEKMRRVG
jgi:hypothetical protein